MKRPLFRKNRNRFGQAIAVNQEHENRKVQIQLKQFESVSNYCENVTCRHQTMAKFFGETIEKCGDRCDGCTIGKQVNRELDCLGKVGSCRTYTTIQEVDALQNDASDEYNPSLYGGKRGGFGFESAELTNDGPAEAFHDESEEQSTKFIQNQFKKRKGKATLPKGADAEESDIHTGYDEDCPLDDPGSRAVSKLGWRVRLACYKQLHDVLETNHVNGYLEQPEKGMMCEEEVRVAASNVEKVIFDSARSKISYKAAIVNRRKEIIICTENFAVHTAFVVSKAVKVTQASCPVASGMFQKASALIQRKEDTPEETEVNRVLPKFMSTADRLKKLKPKVKKQTKLTKQEEDLITKYMKPKEVKIEESGVKEEAKPDHNVQQEVKLKEEGNHEKLMEEPEKTPAPEEAETSDLKIEAASTGVLGEVDDEALTIKEDRSIPPSELAPPPIQPNVKQKLFVLPGAKTTSRVDRLRRLNTLTNTPKKRKADFEDHSAKRAKTIPSSDKAKSSDDSSKKVRFEAAEKSEDSDGSGTNRKEYTPNQLACCKKLVIKIISPYFNAGRFSEKQFFKELAKRVTKNLVSVCLSKSVSRFIVY